MQRWLLNIKNLPEPKTDVSLTSKVKKISFVPDS